MPRAKPFVRSDVDKRPQTLRVDPQLIGKLVKKAALAPKVRDSSQQVGGTPHIVGRMAPEEQLAHELEYAIKAYRAKVVAFKQERPAKIVATLKKGLKWTKKLSEWLAQLPASVRLELKAGGVEGTLEDLAILLEALASNTKSRIAHRERHIRAHRPAGEGAASLSLRQSLTDLIIRYCPDAPASNGQQKRAGERKRRCWVAAAAKRVGARYPHEKNERARFTGERSTKTSAVQSRQVTTARRRRLSKQASAREKTLKDGPL
jgi:hypothetical protein